MFAYFVHSRCVTGHIRLRSAMKRSIERKKGGGKGYLYKQEKQLKYLLSLFVE